MNFQPIYSDMLLNLCMLSLMKLSSDMIYKELSMIFVLALSNKLFGIEKAS